MRVLHQHSLDEILGTVGNIHVFWERIGNGPDSRISFLNVGGFERRLSNEEGVDDNSQRPYVYLI